MSNKRIIIIAVILALALVVTGLIYSGKNKLQGGNNAGEANIVIGNENAPVIIEEYTNFLCSHCADFAKDTLPQVIENYIKTGKVRIVFYVYPPVELAKAAFCANQQGKFMDFHDYVFLHQSEITSESAVFDAVKNAGLDSNSFNQCYNSADAQKAADDWLSKGEKAGATVTPTFFINGQKQEGTLPFEEFKKIIDEKLK